MSVSPDPRKDGRVTRRKKNNFPLNLYVWIAAPMVSHCISLYDSLQMKLMTYTTSKEDKRYLSSYF